MRMRFFLAFFTFIFFVGGALQCDETILKGMDRALVMRQLYRMEFYAEASQDKLVYAILYGLLGKQDKGYYLEIGSGAPIHHSNSYFFEKNLAWSGISIELSPDYVRPWYEVRTNPLIIKDATKVDYSFLLQSFPYEIDYLSLDVDGYYDETLERIPFDEHVFKVITIEHDCYRYGNYYKERERSILSSQGYYLLCADVMTSGYSFEDWWVHPSFFPSDILDAFATLDLSEKDHKRMILTIQSLK